MPNFCLKTRLFSNYSTFSNSNFPRHSSPTFNKKISLWSISGIFVKLRSYASKGKLLLLTLSFLVGNSVVFFFDYILFYVKVYFQNTCKFNYPHLLNVVICAAVYSNNVTNQIDYLVATISY